MQIQSVPPFHPLANIFPLMEGRDFTELVADIQAHGLHEPIILLDGQVLDGRNRLRACVDAGIEPKFETYAGDNPVGFVVSLNLRRRHLNESQRTLVAAKIANLAQGQRTDRCGDRPANLPVSQSDAADMLNVSERSVRAGKVVVDRAVPELTAKVERGDVSVSAAADVATLPKEEQREVVAKGEAEILKEANRIRADRARARKEERVQQIAKAAEGVPSVSERYTLIHGPLTTLLNHPAESVDIICTDPPYPAEFLPVFGQLGEVAKHLLKPGGLLLCMSGQTYLPEVYAQLGQHLDYHWTTAYLTPGGQATQVFPRRVNTFWKPVLIFSKGTYAGDWFGDVTKSDVNNNDKEHHHWGQSVSGMRDLMKRFVQPGHIVVDPFLGGGTTALVALELGATFIGCDVEASAIETTKGRLADAKLVA